MSISYEKNEVNFNSVTYEDEVLSLRDFLQEKAGEAVAFNFKECDDVHMAVLQLVMAYKKNYECSYTFGETKKLFQTVLEGFNPSENHCS